MSRILRALLHPDHGQMDRHHKHRDSENHAAGFRLSDPVSNTADSPLMHSDTNGLLGCIQTFAWMPDIKRLPVLQGSNVCTEQFRSLRSCLYDYRGSNTLKTILISSGMPEEGKTFVAANLAVSLARYKNSRILLVDADLRKNSLHTLFGCSSQPGLSAYLAGEVSERQILQRASAEKGPAAQHPSVVNQITLVAGGEGGESAADLPGKARFSEFIRFVKPHFDWIIVDSSPVNIVSDAVNLASCCDGVLLVARAGKTSYQTLQRATKAFSTATLIGVVLNGATSMPHGGYYSYSTAMQVPHAPYS